MSRILPDGFVNTDIIGDFSVFSLNNTVIGQYAGKVIKGNDNVIIGNNAGKIGVNINNSIFIGADAGEKLYTSENVISIGNENSSSRILNNFVNIGFNDNNNNNNNNNHIKITNDENNLITNKIGFHNKGFSELTIGNYNSNVNSMISIGTSNVSTIENSIIIGNDINNNRFKINIDNLLLTTSSSSSSNNQNVVYLACGAYKDFPIILGSLNETFSNINLSFDGNFLTSSFKIKNSDNNSITFKTNANIDLIYNFPNLPNYEYSYLSTDNEGNLIWLPIDNNIIKTINSTANIICNNFEATNIIGDGSFITNVKMELGDKTTNDLKEGIQNLYYRQSLLTNVFYNYLLKITSSNIKEGKNLYFSSNNYKNNFRINLNEINTDYLSNNKFFSFNDYDNFAYNYLASSYLTTDDLKKGSLSSNAYFDSKDIKFNFDIIKQGTSNLYFNESNYNYLIDSNFNIKTTDNFIEGSVNLYYDDKILNSNINRIFNNLTTDNLNQSNNIYMTSLNIFNYLLSNYPITDDIQQGSNNDYMNFLNSSSSSNKYELISDNIASGNSNYYFTNSLNLVNVISTISTSDTFNEGSVNLYYNTDKGINYFTSNVQKILTTDTISKGNSNKFIENNFYNNNLEIQGFLKTNNLIIIDNPIDLTIGISDSNLLPTIGPNTEIINNYDFERLFINSRLSNINIYYSNANSNQDSNNVPFIIIDNNIGIGTANPKHKLDVNGNVNVRNNFSINSYDYKYNNKSIFENVSANIPTFINGNYGIINQSNYFIEFTQSGKLDIPFSIICECFIVGAGGRGGIGIGGGGGGAGEVIYHPSLFLSNGHYNIDIGFDSPIISNRNSKITNLINGEIIINANGGGDGGYLVEILMSTDLNKILNFTSYAIINKTHSVSLINGNNEIIFANNQININSVIYYQYLPIINETPYFSGNDSFIIFGNPTFNNDLSISISANNYLSLNTNANMNLYSIWNNYGITISIWINLTTASANFARIFEFSTGNQQYTNNWLIMRENNTNNLIFQISEQFTIIKFITSDINFFNNSWYHLVWSISTTGNWKIYVNNNLISNNLTQNPLNISYQNRFIGRSSYPIGDYLNGSIKDFRIYRSVLSDSDISELFTGRIEIMKPPMSGGSGGGAYYNQQHSYLNQSNAISGISLNPIYSKMNAGINGNGGSALTSGRFETNIKGSLLSVGEGGLGVSGLSTLPLIRTNYGDGGNGNGGLGFQGIIILKFTEFFITRLLDYTNWQKLFNINIDSGLSIDTENNNLLSSVWSKTANNIWNNNQANVGIGITMPLYKLDVASGSGETGGISQRFFSQANDLTLSNTNNINICARFGSSIWCQSEIISSSDIRIKTNIKDIESSNALNSILAINPKSYDYIDNNLNNNHNYGFIAQEINEVIPETVSKVSHYIPNIYQYATIITSNELLLSSNLTSDINININDNNDNIRIITNENKEEIYKIRGIKNNSITIEGIFDNQINSEVFIYGTKVNDFQTISKDSIFTLNISATQELYKIIMKQQKEIEYLKSLIIK